MSAYVYISTCRRTPTKSIVGVRRHLHSLSDGTAHSARRTVLRAFFVERTNPAAVLGWCLAAPAAAARWLKGKLGDTMIAGVVLHLGNSAGSLGDGIYALPVSALWGSILPG